MPVRIQNAFSPYTPVGDALNSALTTYANNIPTMAEKADAELKQQRVKAPDMLREAILQRYANAQNGQPLSRMDTQNNMADFVRASAMTGDLGNAPAINRMLQYSANSVQDPQMYADATLGAGGAYSSTREGFRENEANDMAKTRLLANARSGGGTGGDGLTPLQREKRAQLDEAKGRLDTQLTELAGLYDKLDQEGAAVSTEGAYFDNKVNQLMGKVGGVVDQGSKAQSIRNQIESKRQALRLAIMTASGMGTKAFDSNKELEAFMNMVTSPTSDIQASKETIAGLSKMYGKGSFTGMDDVGNGQVSTPNTPMRKQIRGVWYVNPTGDPNDWEQE